MGAAEAAQSLAEASLVSSCREGSEPAGSFCKYVSPARRRRMSVGSEPSVVTRGGEGAGGAAAASDEDSKEGGSEGGSKDGGEVPGVATFYARRGSATGSAGVHSSVELTVPGTALCEVAFVFGVRQHATLIARERTTCLGLARGDYKAVIGEFMGESTKVQGNVLEQVRARADGTAEELRELIEQRKASSLFDLLNAANDGEVDLVRALLKDPESGVNISDSDYDKRTALVSTQGLQASNPGLTFYAMVLAPCLLHGLRSDASTGRAPA